MLASTQNSHKLPHAHITPPCAALCMHSSAVLLQVCLSADGAVCAACSGHHEPGATRSRRSSSSSSQAAVGVAGAVPGDGLQGGQHLGTIQPAAAALCGAARTSSASQAAVAIASYAAYCCGRAWRGVAAMPAQKQSQRCGCDGLCRLYSHTCGADSRSLIAELNRAVV